MKRVFTLWITAKATNQGSWRVLFVWFFLLPDQYTTGFLNVFVCLFVFLFLFQGLCFRNVFLTLEIPLALEIFFVCLFYFILFCLLGPLLSFLLFSYTSSNFYPHSQTVFLHGAKWLQLFQACIPQIFSVFYLHSLTLLTSPLKFP